jgi:hypothetical protein
MDMLRILHIAIILDLYSVQVQTAKVVYRRVADCGSEPN